LARAQLRQRHRAAAGAGAQHAVAAGQRLHQAGMDGGGGQHVVGAGRQGHCLGVGKTLGGDQVQGAQAHGLHGPGGRADVARMLGTDQDDAEIGGGATHVGCGPGLARPVILARRRPDRRLRSVHNPAVNRTGSMQKPVVNVMVKAARAAGNVILRHMGKLDSLNVVEKSRQDYASEVDASAEAEIIRELRRAFPDYGILGEESGAQGRGRSTFVIDPLDGTSNYLRGFPHFCVSIAVVENGEPVHGVVFDPLRNELFTASRGGGALLNDRRIRVGERKDLGGAMLVTGFPPRERPRLGPRLEAVGKLLASAEDSRRTGSAALDLAYVACGRADGYFEAGVKSWDIAAGMLLVREAGGRVCDYQGRSENIL